MEKCFLFICWTVLGADDFEAPGTVLWHSDGWDVVHVIRNNDSTDMGCRLIRTSELGGTMELDAYFLAGNVTFRFLEDLPIQGKLDVGIYGEYGESENWGGELTSGNVKDNLITAELPGQGVISLLLEWSERGVSDLVLVDTAKNQLVVRIPVPGLPEATSAFMECQEAMPW